MRHDRPQVCEQTELATQSKDRLFRSNFGCRIRITRRADRAEEDCIGLTRQRKRRGRKRVQTSIHGGSTDRRFDQLEIVVIPVGDRSHAANRLCRDFRANAVARQDCDTRFHRDWARSQASIAGTCDIR